MNFVCVTGVLWGTAACTWGQTGDVLIAMGIGITCWCHCLQDNSRWDLTMDSQIMTWAVQRPEDWQVGGRGETFVWGSGRHGQMCEAGRVSTKPVKVPSLSACQQVSSSFLSTGREVDTFLSKSRQCVSSSYLSTGREVDMFLSKSRQCVYVHEVVWLWLPVSGNVWCVYMKLCSCGY